LRLENDHRNINPTGTEQLESASTCFFCRKEQQGCQDSNSSTGKEVTEKDVIKVYKVERNRENEQV